MSEPPAPQPSTPPAHPGASLGPALLVAGACGGILVGLLWGVSAALRARLDLGGVAATVGLVAGTYAALGAALGVATALAVTLVGFGHRRPAGRLATALGTVLAGAGASAAGVALIVGTAARNNRFLAAGLVVLASAGAAIGGALLAPTIGRALTFGRGRRGRDGRAEPNVAGASAPVRRATPAGVLWLAPLLLLLVEGLVFLLIWRTRAPLALRVRTQRSIAVGVLVFALPALLQYVALLLPSISLRKAAPLAVTALGLPLGALVVARWRLDFQFLPWTDLAVAAAITSATGLVALWLRNRTPRVLTGALLALLAACGGAALALGAAASEVARKAASDHAGLVGTWLTVARAALDKDRDGYPRLLGGGDCDDNDRDVNPGALDWPGDGKDQDCDGLDASLEGMAPPAFAEVPASVPADANFLFVTVDTLRADRLGAYGYKRPTTPHIDRVAADGILFENGWAHAPSTRYSMPTIATGRWPSTVALDPCTGCDSWWHRIAPGQTTIGEAMHALGLKTGAFYAYSYFGKSNARGYERGIDDYRDRCAALHMNLDGPAESRGSSSREMADDAIDFLERSRDRRWFLWLHFYDPHLQYERHPDAPDFGAGAGDLYDGEVWFTDHHLGRVFDRLRALGLYDKTIIFVTGDHGEALGERGISAHGYHLFAPHTKVPFVARVPGLAPRRVKEPVGHVDLAPTLVNLARGTRPKSFLGRSLVDLMAGKASPKEEPPRTVWQEVSYEGPTELRALVSNTHHLIWHRIPENTTYCFTPGTDPREEHDLWGSSAGRPICDELKRELHKQIARMALPPDLAEKLAFGVTPPGQPAPAPAQPAAAETRIGSQLRFLGVDAPATAVPLGTEVEVVTHLEVLAPIPKGWHMFFHLQPPAGAFSNLDHVAVEGAHPVERWQAGQKIRDRVRVRFAGMPPGTYTIYLGFWRAGSAERLPVTPSDAQDGGDRLRVATIVVTPG